MNKFKSVITALVVFSSLLFVSCSDSDSDDGFTPGGTGSTAKDFQIAFASGSGSNSATTVQGVSELSTGAVSSRVGFELESSRTARIFSSTNGKYIYSLNYTVGTIEKLEYVSGSNYKEAGRIDASVPLKTKTVRFSKLTDKYASVHYIKATAQYENPEDANSKYLGHKMVLSLGILDLETMAFLSNSVHTDLEVRLDDALAKEGYYISRIDAPVVSGGKIYYGASVNKFNTTTGKGVSTEVTYTLVLDYPSLTNPTIEVSPNAVGATNGYRTPTQHFNEDGDIYQLASTSEEVHILKLRNGKYVADYDFNLSAKLNKGTKSNGWFYAGNGIGYVPYEDLSKDKVQTGVDPEGNPTYSAMWKLARVNLNDGTVVDLNVPNDLWLTQYQNSVVKDGKFYIALAPIGVVGNIYIFDIASTSKDGVKGTELVGTGADQYYIGIY